jgi:CDP-ribitol ribitolphosphotransferase
MIEYALLNKPIIFYPYDYEYYVKEDRGFYFNYLENVPGPIACTPHEIIRIIKEDFYDFEKIRKFAELEFGELDGKSTQRIINHIIK